MRCDLIPALDRHIIEFGKACTPEEFWRGRDCVSFVAGWVLTVTGLQLIPDGITWDSAETAAAAMATLDCDDTFHLADKFLPARPVLYARRGDIVGRDFPDTGKTLGICTGSDARFVTLRGGIFSVPLRRCDRAWEVEQCLQS